MILLEKQRLRRSLWWAQQGICPLCRKPIMDPEMTKHAKHKSPGFPLIDHVLPLSRGGADVARNTLLVHRICNQKRGSAHPTRRLLRILYWVHRARALRHLEMVKAHAQGVWNG